MIPENVKKFFNENLWYIATCGDKDSVPNVVPVGFKRVCSDGKLAVGAVLLETTLENIKANGKVAVACANSMTGEAYEHYCKLTKDTFKGTMELKCAIIITPEKLINASPNEHNKEEISI